MRLVALLAEGMDRNCENRECRFVLWVALLAEGVDRNLLCTGRGCAPCPSPSSRRAWIEIETIGMLEAIASVALLAEGADRNTTPEASRPGRKVALLAEGVDRNDKGYKVAADADRRPPHGGRG